MASKVFTTKKMKMENQATIRKGLIITAIIAIIGGAGFGGYMLTKDESETPQRSAQTTAKRVETSSTSQIPNGRSPMPAFAHTESAKPETKKMSGKRSTEGKASKSKKKHVANHKKGKKQKLAAHKKHKKHKIAANKKHKKHKIAANKKHKKQHGKQSTQLNRKMAER